MGTLLVSSSEKRTVFQLEAVAKAWKTANFEEQIMRKDKYMCIFFKPMVEWLLCFCLYERSWADKYQGSSVAIQKYYVAGLFKTVNSIQ